SACMISRVADAAQSRQGAVLRLKEEMTSDTCIDDVLSISPVIAVKLQSNLIDRLRLIETLIDLKISRAAGTEVVFVGHLREVWRKKIREIRYLLNRTNPQSLRAQPFQNSR